MSIDTEERSRLAKDPYNNREKGRIYNIDGLDYKILETTNLPSGYQATAYQRVDNGEVVIANRGTEFNKLSRQPLLDSGTDLGMVRDGYNSQHKRCDGLYSKGDCRSQANRT